MSISAISDSTSTYQDRLNQLRLVRQDLSGLSSSLASGDLTASQNAFATLMQDLGTAGAQSTPQTNAAGQVSTDLTALGDALNSKDITSAQKAYATLVQDIQNDQRTQKAHHHHHHRRTGSAQNTSGDLNIALASLGAALQSGDLTASQNAFAALVQDLGTSGTPGTTAVGSTGVQSATGNQSSATASMPGALQVASSDSQSGSASYASTLLQALNLYAQLGQFGVSSPAAALLSAIG